MDKKQRDSFQDIVEKCKRGDFSYNWRPEYLEDLPEGPRMLAAKGVPLSDTQEFIMREFLPRISLDKCTRCGICWVFCPLAVISVNEAGYPVIDEEFCRPCGVCFNECPPSCISMVKLSESER